MSRAGQPRLFSSLWDTGLWRYFPFLLIYSIGLATVFPVIPTIITNGFASQAAGKPVDCQQFTPATSPPECRNAHSQAVFWNSWTSFVSGTILSSLCAPAVGKLSDIWGRKPFILAAVGLAFAPMLVLVVHLWGWVPIEWYFVTSTLGGVVSSFSMTMVAVADLLQPAFRATAIGYISATFSIGVLLGPVLGGYISNLAAIYVCITMMAFTWLYVLLFIQESAPAIRACAHSASQHGASCDSQGGAAAAERSCPSTGLHSRAAGSKSRAGTPLAGNSRDGSQPFEHELTAPGHVHGVGCDRQQQQQQDESEDEGEAAMIRPLLQLEADPIPAVVPHAHDVLMPPSMQHRRHGHAHGHGHAHCSHRHSHHEGDASAPLLAHEHAPCGEVSGQGAHGYEGGAGVGRRTPGGARSDDGSSDNDDERGTQASKGSAMLVGWRIIRGSPWYCKLAAIWVIVSMTNEGAQDLLMQYLQLRLGFNTRDQANLLVIVAGCGLAIKLTALPWLVRVLGEQWLLALGLTAYAVETVLFALATTKGAAFAAIAVGAWACVNWPAAVALQTRYVDPHNMGAVTGALQGLSSIASGIGPILFAALFSAVTKEGSKWYMPQAVWWVASGLTLSAVALTATLHWSAPKEGPAPAAAGGASGHGGHADASRQGRDEEEASGSRAASKVHDNFTANGTAAVN
eukprot:CAMPEP_0202867458 /NCGR_PEP_ID=MMETSP1391-20130828/9446_1 /ASSEMBLY_ACC=CAM_ASM_000867 /TAXON_ID=1034604 /ORGANISM="Chlamydomonas leiostraca, Strain SAG 11-49" /LENGTH=684 /DNA_ID=CAMNT_0049547505 /DNA_START=141 /DNA_END=2195 /DNA_ORIENTATION=-